MFGRLTRATKQAARKFVRNWNDGWPGNAGSFDAAGRGDRWPRSSLVWAPVSQSLAAAGLVARRADWLVINSPSAASFVETWVTSVVSTGPTVRSKHPDPETRRMLERSWARFTGRCDAEGTGDLTGLLSKTVRNMVTTGESVVHLVIVDRALRLKLIATEQVARAWTRILPDGTRILSGVELDLGG
jgi:hypothetical protein